MCVCVHFFRFKMLLERREHGGGGNVPKGALSDIAEVCSCAVQAVF